MSRVEAPLGEERWWWKIRVSLGHAGDDRVRLSVVERIDWLWPSDGGTSSGWLLPGKMDSVEH